MKFLTLLFTTFTLVFAGTFLPENDLKRPVISRSTAGEMMFNRAISEVANVYQDLLYYNYNKGLNIESDWEDSTVNAYTYPSAGMVNIKMFGGLFRHEKTTYDGFVAVLCHEMGHNVGGLPKYARYGYPEWAVNEGGSDYYATAKCTKLVFAQDMVTTYKLFKSPKTKADHYAKYKCKFVFKNDRDAALCYRSIKAGESLGNLLASLSGKKVSTLTPSSKKVNKTNVWGYPSSQCRLDTYVAGSLCDQNPEILASETDEMHGYCDRGLGQRPRCWYKN